MEFCPCRAAGIDDSPLLVRFEHLQDVFLDASHRRTADNSVRASFPEIGAATSEGRRAVLGSVTICGVQVGTQGCHLAQRISGVRPAGEAVRAIAMETVSPARARNCIPMDARALRAERWARRDL